MLYRAAGFGWKVTGLPFYVWVFPRAGARGDLRIMTRPTHRFDRRATGVMLLPSMRIPARGTLSDIDITQLRVWAARNIAAITDFWNEDIDEDDVRDRIRPIR